MINLLVIAICMDLSLVFFFFLSFVRALVFVLCLGAVLIGLSRFIDCHA